MPAWSRLLAGAAAVAAVALASHWLMLGTADRPWGALLVLAPLLLGLALVALRRRHVGALVGCVLGAALLAFALAAALRRGDAGELQRLYLLQHAGTHALLALVFGLTLRPGRRALITRLAETVHTRLTPAMRAYTRRLTAAWTVYFGTMTLVSLLLHAVAPWHAWSVFANLVTPLCLVVFFVGEHLLRYRWHPEFERVDVRRSIRAWRERHEPPHAAPTLPPAP
jgi:uncharacterized membrane protein